jgi:squalene-hopene/tetraprenyl-beta-curcumene cyclase
MQVATSNPHTETLGNSSNLFDSDIFPERMDTAIRLAQASLLKRQNPSGYWAGELRADASVPAGYIPLMVFMRGEFDPQRAKRIVNSVKAQQNPDGSWSSHYAGPGDLNVSIQTYFGLKLAGVSGQEPFMQRGRDFILSQDGIRKSSVFTKIWLALFGQYDWSGTPSLPPEIIFLPGWFYLNIYEFASWSRETLMALSLVLTLKPVCPIPAESGVDELYLEPKEARVYRMGKIERLFSWRSFFLLADRLFKLWERLPAQPGRKRAMQRVVDWIVEHQETDGSWGGILLPWIYSLYALKSFGFGLDHPVIQKGLDGFEDFIIEDQSGFGFQPATSPVWDTAWNLIALRDSGLAADHPALVKAAGWLVGKEIRKAGDWRVKNPEQSPGGWSFEFANDWYPDMDDSAVVPRALIGVRLPDPQEQSKSQAIQRALEWVLSMQSKDGGWGAFDRDNDKQILTQVPFADFMSPLDPTCADVTAHVMEMLVGLNQGQAALKRAVEFLKVTQEADGAWYGRWGVNYVYGTGLSLAGLAAAGEDLRQPFIQRAIAWLISHQNPDGGWGETCQTYEDPGLRGIGPSTASQTAWSLIGLIKAGETASSAVQAGIDYLLRTQAADGAWVEEYYTGAGFPKVFYLRYDFYRLCFPLIALALYRNHLSSPTDPFLSTDVKSAIL